MLDYYFLFIKSIIYPYFPFTLQQAQNVSLPLIIINRPWYRLLNNKTTWKTIPNCPRDSLARLPADLARLGSLTTTTISRACLPGHINTPKSRQSPGNRKVRHQCIQATQSPTLSKTKTSCSIAISRLRQHNGLIIVIRQPRVLMVDCCPSLRNQPRQMALLPRKLVLLAERL